MIVDFIWTTRMWNDERNDALDSYIARSSRRGFGDGVIAGLQIQEYWQPDISPSGSEQSMVFYRAKSNAFESFDDFVLVARLFDYEDDVSESARFTFALEDLRPISTSRFLNEWKQGSAKIQPSPSAITSDLINAVTLCDCWNEKFFAARDSEFYYAFRWATSA